MKAKLHNCFMSFLRQVSQISMKIKKRESGSISNPQNLKYFKKYC